MTTKLNDGGMKKKKEVVKQRLTDVVIDKLQNYFGIALRGNIGNLKKMQDAIFASMFRVASSEEEIIMCIARRHQILNASITGVSKTGLIYIKHDLVCQ